MTSRSQAVGWECSDEQHGTHGFKEIVWVTQNWQCHGIWSTVLASSNQIRFMYWKSRKSPDSGYEAKEGFAAWQRQGVVWSTSQLLQQNIGPWNRAWSQTLHFWSSQENVLVLGSHEVQIFLGNASLQASRPAATGPVSLCSTIPSVACECDFEWQDWHYQCHTCVEDSKFIPCAALSQVFEVATSLAGSCML